MSFSIDFGGPENYSVDEHEGAGTSNFINLKSTVASGGTKIVLPANGKVSIEDSSNNENCKIEHNGIITCVDTIISGHGSLSEAVFGSTPSVVIDVIDGLTIYPNVALTNNLTINSNDVASISTSDFNNFIMYNTEISTSYAQFDITTPSHDNYIIGIVDKFGIDNSTNTNNWMTNAIMTYNFGLTASFNAVNCTVRYNGSTDNLNYTTLISTAQPDKLQIGIDNTASSIEFILISGTSVLRTLKIVYAYGFPFGNMENKRICMSLSDTSTTVEAPETPLAWQGTLTGLTYISLENDNPITGRVGRLETEMASIESHLTDISGSYISADKPGKILGDQITEFETRITCLESFSFLQAKAVSGTYDFIRSNLNVKPTIPQEAGSGGTPVSVISAINTVEPSSISTTSSQNFSMNSSTGLITYSGTPTAYFFVMFKINYGHLVSNDNDKKLLLILQKNGSTNIETSYAKIGEGSVSTSMILTSVVELSQNDTLNILWISHNDTNATGLFLFSCKLDVFKVGC